MCRNFQLSWCYEHNKQAKTWHDKANSYNREYHFFRRILPRHGCFQSWALKKLPNPYRANADAVARYSVVEAFRILSLLQLPLWFSYSPLGLGGGVMLRQDQASRRCHHVNVQTSKNITIYEIVSLSNNAAKLRLNPNQSSDHNARLGFKTTFF